MATYITARGAQALSRELAHLATHERPRVVQEVAEAAAQGDRSENAEYIYGKKRLREIDRRLRFLTKRLDDAHVVDVTQAPPASDKVYFGAIVCVEDEDGEERVYQLVGPDETDPERGQVSYQSPIGRALLQKTVGDTVSFSRPAGHVELTIVSVEYGRMLGAG